MASLHVQISVSFVKRKLAKCVCHGVNLIVMLHFRKHCALHDELLDPRRKLRVGEVDVSGLDLPAHGLEPLFLASGWNHGNEPGDSVFQRRHDCASVCLVFDEFLSGLRITLVAEDRFVPRSREFLMEGAVGNC